MIIKLHDGDEARVTTSQAKFKPAAGGSYGVTQIVVEGSFETTGNDHPRITWSLWLKPDSEDWGLLYLEDVDFSGYLLNDEDSDRAVAVLELYVVAPIRAYYRSLIGGMMTLIQEDNMSLMRGLLRCSRS